ncbi:hypothetical protein BJ546DRAFT_435985 [Cryomyces antarcticus]
MNVQAGESAHEVRSRSRKSSLADVTPLANAGYAAPTSFFLRREEDLERMEEPTSKLPRPGTARRQQEPPKGSERASSSDSTYGVQSLEDAIGAAFPDVSHNTPSGATCGSTTSLASDKGNTAGPRQDDGSPMSKKRKPGNPIHPNIAAAAQRIISHEQPRPSTSASSTSSPVRNKVSSPLHTQLQARQPSPATSSSPHTPLHLSPAPESGFASTPRSSSIRSFRLSDEESLMDDSASQTSQAIQSSSGEEEEEGDTLVEPGDNGTSEEKVHGISLVMPSIAMPSRRPFTDRGKSMGRLKVMVAGVGGVGKTSLIKSIVQTCEDIVHVDPLSPSLPTIQIPEPDQSKVWQKRKPYVGRTGIVEIYASTRPYPQWWSDLEESRVLKRRKSMGDTVLERNLCFVDTPGSNGKQERELAVQYIESQMHRNANIGTMSDSDLLGVLSGSGGVQVDVLLYLIDCLDGCISRTDLEFVECLSTLTNVVPIISKADSHSPTEISKFKVEMLKQLRDHDVKPFLFGKSITEALRLASEVPLSSKPSTETTATTSAPFAVSSTPAANKDVLEYMDASLLMSPEYIQPLSDSDLLSLVNQLFDPENTQWLRHSAVKKFLQWRHTLGRASIEMQMQKGLGQTGLGVTSPAAAPSFHRTTTPLSTTGSLLSSPRQVLIPHPNHHSYHSTNNFTPSSPLSSNSSNLGPSSYSLARYTDHTHRETALAQVRLARWAADLQRSLQNERERYARLARGQRSEWLLERVDEEFPDGQMANMALVKRADGSIARVDATTACGRRAGGGVLDARDPLGLLHWGEGVKRTGWGVLKFVAGSGLVGALVVWAVRSWGFGVWSGSGGEGEGDIIGGPVAQMGVANWDWSRGAFAGWW